MQYRPEVDGLRALAVLPVIFFHAGYGALSGGFVGVDVFFVISGYLITSIIAAELEAGSFSLLTFYERRARRILPALAVVVAACLGVGWFVLLPQEFKTLGQSAVAVAAFASNLFFLGRIDYFKPAAELNPLLHTWSLAIEEQYYVLFPLLLMLLWSLRWQRGAVWVVAGIGLCSLALAEWGWRANPTLAFYMLPTRAWELMAGAVLALRYAETQRWARANPRWAAWAAWLGLAMLAGSIATFDRSVPSPSLYIALPVLGTVMLLACASPANLVGRLLAFRPVVFVGLLSYSAYLWHQPLFAFKRIAASLGEGATLGLGWVVAPLVLAMLTYRVVEQPFRKKRLAVSRAPLLFSSAGALVLMMSAGLIIDKSNGFEGRVGGPGELARLEGLLDTNFGLHEACEYREPFVPKSECTHGTAPTTLLWGDSYAMHLAPALQAQGIAFVQATRSNCGPSAFDAPLPERKIYFEPWARECLAFNRDVLTWLQASPNIRQVVMASAWTQYLSGKFYNAQQGAHNPTERQRRATFEATVEAIKALGKEVIVVSPTPANGMQLGDCVRRAASGLISLAATAGAACSFKTVEITPDNLSSANLSRQIAENAKAPFIDLRELMCDGGVCAALQSGTPMYRDSVHLSHAGGIWLAQQRGLFRQLR